MTRVTQAHIDARIEDILSAALRVFGRKGAQAATMQEIATEAGLSAGAIYRYFENKDDLVRAVYEHAVTASRNLFAEAAASAESPLDALKMAGYLALDQESGADSCLDLDLTIAALREETELAEVYRATNKEVHAAIAGFVRTAQAAGEIGKELDAELLARVLLALVNGLRLELMDTQTATDGRAAIDLVGTMLRATAARGGRGASHSS